METSQRFKKFLVFLFPALLLLTACEVEGIMEIKPGGKVAMEIHLADDTGMMQQMGLSCQGLTEQAGIDTAINDENGTLTVKDNSADGELDCLITANSSHPIIDGKNLVETDDTYIFYLNGDKTSFVDEDQLGLLGLVDFDFSFTVKMPGKIISADGAEISGNTARFTKFTALLKGVKVEGLKSPDKTAGAAPDNGSALGFKSGPDNQGTGSTILHTIAVTAIAILVLAAALIIFLMLRNKRKKTRKLPAAVHILPIILTLLLTAALMGTRIAILTVIITAALRKMICLTVRPTIASIQRIVIPGMHSSRITNMTMRKHRDISRSIRKQHGKVRAAFRRHRSKGQQESSFRRQAPAPRLLLPENPILLLHPHQIQTTQKPI
ncbi:hypothetical protein RQN30_08990 [Arcanobacterium hippocoleae]